MQFTPQDITDLRSALEWALDDWDNYDGDGYASMDIEADALQLARERADRWQALLERLTPGVEPVE